MKSSSPQNQALLPAGFEDLLPPDAASEYAAIATLMDVFSKFGYGRVKPPIAEFEESLFAPGPGAALSNDTFRMMDPDTHRMMGLRSDITAQIARIALSRLSEEARPLRLTYANDVIRTRASQARTKRQFTQVGCEMVGRSGVESDIEVCVVALKGLMALGLEDITVDFALPVIFDDIFTAAGEPKSEIDSLRARLAGPVDSALEALDDLPLSDEARGHVEALKTVIAGVRRAADELSFEGVSFTLDPLETKGFEYHHGVAFALFAKGVRGELGRGGHYLIYRSGEAEPAEHASGFTYYMDTVRQGLKALPDPKVKTVSVDESWAKIEALQNDGFIVRRG